MRIGDNVTMGNNTLVVSNISYSQQASNYFATFDVVTCGNITLDRFSLQNTSALPYNFNNFFVTVNGVSNLNNYTYLNATVGHGFSRITTGAYLPLSGSRNLWLNSISGPTDFGFGTVNAANFSLNQSNGTGLDQFMMFVKWSAPFNSSDPYAGNGLFVNLTQIEGASSLLVNATPLSSCQ